MLVLVFERIRCCALLNPPQLLLSAARANVREAPAESVPVKLSVSNAFPGGQKPASAPELPARLIVPVKSVPLFLTVRKPVSTDEFASPMQTPPLFPVDSQTSG